MKLGVVSNFDTRLRPLMRSLNCDHWFDAVAVSAEVCPLISSLYIVFFVFLFFFFITPFHTHNGMASGMCMRFIFLIGIHMHMYTDQYYIQ